VIPCKNHPKRGTLFCHDHVYENGQENGKSSDWNIIGTEFDIYNEARPFMKFHTSSLNQKTPKDMNHCHVAKSSGENVLDESEVRRNNLQIFSNMRDEEEIVLNHRMISNHPSAYHLNRACYDYRLIFSIIAYMAEEDEESLTDAKLMEVFGMFLCRKCCADIPGKGMCNKKSCHGSIWCEKHYENHLGYDFDVCDAEIYLSVFEKQKGNHFSTRSIMAKKSVK